MLLEPFSYSKPKQASICHIQLENLWEKVQESWEKSIIFQCSFPFHEWLGLFQSNLPPEFYILKVMPLDSHFICWKMQPAALILLLSSYSRGLVFDSWQFYHFLLFVFGDCFSISDFLIDVFLSRILSSAYPRANSYDYLVPRWPWPTLYFLLVSLWSTILICGLHHIFLGFWT